MIKKLLLIISLFMPCMQLAASQQSSYKNWALAGGIAGLVGTSLSVWSYNTLTKQKHRSAEIVAEIVSADAQKTKNEIAKLDNDISNLHDCNKLFTQIFKEHHTLQAPIGPRFLLLRQIREKWQSACQLLDPTAFTNVRVHSFKCLNDSCKEKAMEGYPKKVGDEIFYRSSCKDLGSEIQKNMCDVTAKREDLEVARNDKQNELSKISEEHQKITKHARILESTARRIVGCMLCSIAFLGYYIWKR